MSTETAIVLVEPAGPLNLGAVARVMKNFGLTDLRLVAPHCTPQDPEALLMAVHAQEVLSGAQLFSTLGEALADRERVVGTTARTRDLPVAMDPAQALGWLVGRGALVFGPEDRGLSNQELALCQRWLTLPTHPAYPSLNLAQAVGICCYELDRTPPEPTPTVALAAASELAGFYDHASELLLEIGYLQPHTQARRLAKLRRIFSRAQLTSAEVALLRGVVRQMRWATARCKDASIQ
ncbi:RNA methyltransferase [Candidatus Cyanaurora vandensis]|uniref:RNA methyltransferase n=1 Tax=Candidatus Cyanaurora vandensis TaxID=2714958 RepID=UPI00257DE7FF|nr:RNA methyltransferase [Candidatus Cyanaurora vandensis]